MVTGKTLIDRFERFAPKSLAVPGDPIGIQIGDATRQVHTMLVTLDVRPEVVEEAIRVNADMIFAHHPAVFRPAHNLNYADPQNRMYGDLMKHDILVYAAHTNLDRVAGGMNDWLSAALGLDEVQPFIESGEEANMGRIGTLPAPVSLGDFVQQVKDTFAVRGLRVIARDLDRPVQKVAVLGGDGGKFFRDAKLAGADVYVTGDVYYHTGHDMLAADMAVIDPGHHIESIMKDNVRALFITWAQAEDWPLHVVASQLNTDPFTFM
ncbi:Nif3-like dinuclear metal center hexameric protein [Lacticaseibacillus mingshuiensis]|uniref:Nif3-like dinuclear metal center hexameric protein n=1 Tax=Lacticaseibacillus mingshuiensis TaxID=2799574 RepID=UPI00194EF840|nr:Nif3-like dinuclear metal center hexameric protein [Lacticaseibacillus mingshuiensis]